MYKADDYTYDTTWSQSDNQMVGICEEFPSLSYVGKTKAEAVDGIKDVVATVLGFMYDDGEVPPIPNKYRNGALSSFALQA